MFRTADATHISPQVTNSRHENVSTITIIAFIVNLVIVTMVIISSSKANALSTMKSTE